MSDPEKTKMDTKEEINNENNNPQESDYLSSDEEEEDELEEGEFRELVLGIPSKRVAEESLDIVDDQALHEKAIIAAQLFVAAAEEAGATQINPDSNGGSGSGEKTNKKKVGRPRKVRLDHDNVMAKAEGSGSIAIGGEGGELPVKKPRKKGSTKLTHPPQGPPRCNICGKGFGSWKAVFGHLRLHKDRGYVGFLPPPMFNMDQEGIGGVVVGSSSGGGGFGLGTGGLDIDLNVEPMEKEEEDEGTGSTLKFDLNRSPPQEEEDKEEEA